MIHQVFRIAHSIGLLSVLVPTCSVWGVCWHICAICHRITRCCLQYTSVHLPEVYWSLAADQRAKLEEDPT